MLEACGAANARRPWRKPQCIELSADEAAEARTDSNSSDETAVARLVRVPNNLLGKLLDHGRAGAYALHLIAFKLLHGAGWAISEGQVAKPPNQGGIGMGERKLRKGLALAKAQGVLDRRIGGRRPNGRAAFARERLAAGSGRYIELPETLIRSSDSKLLAFVAAILLAPFPQDARDIAERIGLSRRSPNAIKRLVKTATADHHIAAEHVGRHWIVARPGVNLAVFQNVAIQNVVIQNVAIHSLLEDDHRKQEDDHKKQQAKRVTPQPPSPATAQRLMCHVDGAECEVTASIMTAIVNQCAKDADKAGPQLAQSLGQARRALPCYRCRDGTAAAARLPGTRLGQRERDLLLRASASDANAGVLVCDAADARAVKEAKKRAARRLAHAGLIWTGSQEVEVERADPRRGKCQGARDGDFWYFREDLTQKVRVRVVVAGLTPLGEEIKRRYQLELDQGLAIRWDARVAESASVARHDHPHLLARTTEYLRDEGS